MEDRTSAQLQNSCYWAAIMTYYMLLLCNYTLTGTVNLTLHPLSRTKCTISVPSALWLKHFKIKLNVVFNGARKIPKSELRRSEIRAFIVSFISVTIKNEKTKRLCKNKCRHRNHLLTPILNLVVCSHKSSAKTSFSYLCVLTTSQTTHPPQHCAAEIPPWYLSHLSQAHHIPSGSTYTGLSGMWAREQHGPEDGKLVETPCLFCCYHSKMLLL